MRFALTVAALLAAVGAFAADVTVTGGNWSGFGVQSGDSVTVTGNSVNDLSGLTLGSLAFTATATVSGEKVILNGGAAALSVASGATVTSTLPLELASGEQTLTVDGTLAQSGVISGAGLLNKKGAGTLELRATNTYAGGTRLWRENDTAAG